MSCQNGWVDGPSYAVCEGIKVPTCSAFDSCVADSAEDLVRVTQLGAQAIPSICTYPSVAVAPVSDDGGGTISSGGSGDSVMNDLIIFIVIIAGSLVAFAVLWAVCLRCGSKKTDAARKSDAFVDIELTEVYSATSNVFTSPAPVQPSPRVNSPSSARTQSSSSPKKDRYEKEKDSEFYENVAENIGEKVGEHVANALGDTVADAVGDMLADQVLGRLPMGAGALAKFAYKSAKNSSKKKGNN